MNIEGLTIKFAADTSGLDDKMKKVESASKKTANELKRIDAGLKFNPRNVTLLNQKFDALKRSVKQSETRLAALRAKQQQFDKAGVSKTSKQYRELEREIIKTENQLDRAKQKLKEFGSVRIQRVSTALKGAGDKLTKAGNAMRGFSRACAVATAAIGALAVKSGRWADDLNTMSKVYHISTQELQKYAIAADLVDVDIETIAKSHQKLEKTMESATKKGSASAKAFKKLGVNVKDSNGNFRDSEDVFNDAITALAGIENETERDQLAMKLFGKSAAELNPLIEDGGKTYKELSDTLKKYGLEPISQESLDKANAFNDQLDMIKAIGLTTFQTLGTQLAAQFAPVLEKVVDLVGRLAGWFTSLSPQTQTIIAAVVAIGAVIAPLLIGLGKLAFAINAIITLAGTIGPVIGGAFAAASIPIAPLIIAIGAAIAVGVLLYKNWDKVKAFMIRAVNTIKTKFFAAFNAIKQNLTKWKANVTAIFNGVRDKLKSVQQSMSNFKSRVASIFSGVKDAITKPINTAKNAISKFVSKVKGMFDGIKIKFPHVPYPHFGIEPKGWKLGDLAKGKIPKLTVSTYANAMQSGRILSGATMFGEKNGRILQGGEVGRELIIGANSAAGLISGAVARGINSAAGILSRAVGTQTALASAGPQDLVVNVYLYKNGPQMGREIVKVYDTWKAKLG